MAADLHLPVISSIGHTSTKTVEADALPFGVSFSSMLSERGLPALRADRATTLQINVGKVCNQACHHCHVEAGPKRTEQMTAATAERVIALMKTSSAIDTVDITGGAPELNPNFRRLVEAARHAERTVIDRSNLTVLYEPGQEDLAAFLATWKVNVVASLPCYSQENVDTQRGKGVFGKSISALQRFNQLGYGRPGSGLILDLVYNPGGASLPPEQAVLEADYKERLAADFGIVFNQLYTLTNMPIRRFAHSLARDGAWVQYMQLLVDSFNAGTVDGLMCRSQVNIGYDGKLYDCDFNQMLELNIDMASADDSLAAVPTIWDLDSLDQLTGRRIKTDGHCFGCTAGSGSSCGGALDAK